MQKITAQQLSTMLEQDEHPPLLLDVRETAEHQICQIEGSLLIPMQLIPSELNEGELNKFDVEHKIVVICHHGMRSLKVAEYLQDNGFNQVMNLDGGIEQWRLTVDSTMSAY